MVLGLLAVVKLGVAHLCIKGDSNLVVKKTSREFAIQESALAEYRILVPRLINKFERVRIEHVPRLDNRFSDALATLASKVDVPKGSTNIEVIKMIHPCTVLTLLPPEEISD